MSAPTTTEAPSGAMTHRQIMEALSGLLLVLFVAMSSATIVSTALPKIIGSLNGSQTQYTWVVTATLLTATATTPIWGKLADLYSKKLLVQLALVIYTIGSLIAALAPSMEVLIGARVVQGLGVGGLTALGRQTLAEVNGWADRSLADTLQHWDPEDVAVLAALLRRFTTDLLTRYHHNPLEVAR